jgi:SAM-dependent methyltransferase
VSSGDEPRALAARYARRAVGDLYSPLRPEVWHTLRERHEALLSLLGAQGIQDVAGLRLVEVGCGTGGNLLELLHLGFAPEHLQGLELLPERLAQARHVLPAALALRDGDAVQAPIEPGSQDLVLVSTVFSSLLDDAFQQQLADAIWRWLRPGGAVLWYDFTVDNPRNRDVRGVPLARVAQLFPQGRLTHRRITLAPPLARHACRIHPGLYRLFNALPVLRTHVLAWVGKPVAG